MFWQRTLKKLIVPLTLWTVVVLVSLLWNLRQVELQVTDVAYERGRYMFKVIQLTRQWNAQHGGVYVPVTKTQQPNPYLDVPDRDIQPVDGIKLTKVNPAYMTRQIAELAAKEGVVFHITSLNPIRPANKADLWESEQLFKFEAEKRNEIIDILTVDGMKSYRYMAPLIVKQACLKCHETQGYKLGDIRGGISVSMDYDSIQKSSSGQKRNLVILYFVVWIIVAALLFMTLVRHFQYVFGLKKDVESQSNILKNQAKEIDELSLHTRRIFDLSDDLICTASFDGNFLVVNHAFQRMLKYSEEEILNIPFINMVVEADREKTMKSMSILTKGEIVSDFTNRYQTKDGRILWISWKATPDVNKQEIYAVGRDITQLKEKEEKLKASLEKSKESEEKYRILFDRAIDAVMLAEVESGLVVDCNEQAEKLFKTSLLII